jgi:hypothetical protein
LVCSFLQVLVLNYLNCVIGLSRNGSDDLFNLCFKGLMSVVDYVALCSNLVDFE